MKYVVVRDFKDLKDNDRIYISGDTFPHTDAKQPTARRFKELAGTDNKHKAAIIKQVPLTEEEIEEVKEQEALEKEEE